DLQRLWADVAHAPPAKRPELERHFVDEISPKAARVLEYDPGALVRLRAAIRAELAGDHARAGEVLALSVDRSAHGGLDGPLAARCAGDLVADLIVLRARELAASQRDAALATQRGRISTCEQALADAQLEFHEYVARLPQTGDAMLLEVWPED